MLAPDAFYLLFSQFQLDILSEVGTEEQMIRSGIQILSEAERLEVINFLGGLLNGDKSSSELNLLWNSTQADFFLADDEKLISFLRSVKTLLSDSRAG